jgi:hypothetical protein
MAVLKLHKMKSPRSLERDLKDEFPTSRNHRFGTAFVDTDDNPKLVKFILNKPISGMARRLAKTLKGTGFSKVQILLDDGTVVEAEEEEEEGTAPSDPNQTSTAPGGVVPPGPPPPPPPPTMVDPAENAAKLAELQKLLAQLAPQIPKVAGQNASLKADLMKLATEANTNLKTNNLVYAATALEQLKRALETPVATAETFTKARSIWVATRQKVQQELDKLGAELGKTYAEEPVAGQVKTAYQAKRDDLLRRVDGDLLPAIEALVANADPTRRDALVEQARTVAKELQTMVDADPLVDALDDNPFVPLSLHKTLMTSLNGITGSLR